MDSLAIGIIESLKQKNDFTSDELGRILSVSERTVRNRMKEINEEIINHGAVIHSKRGSGYHLEIINKDDFNLWLDQIHNEEKGTPNSPEERLDFLIDYLLNQDDYVYIDDLCELIYVARNTMTSDLKKVEQSIRKYNLVIERRPNYGIAVRGREIDKRMCMLDYILHYLHKGQSISRIRTTPMTAVYQKKFPISFLIWSRMQSITIQRTEAIMKEA